MNKAGFLMLCLVLAGCANKSQTEPSMPIAPLPIPTTEPRAPAAIPEKTTNLTASESCMKSLSALKTYNVRSWKKYSAEMRGLTDKTSKFLSVKEDLNSTTNDLVMNAYDSRMKTLCYKIESTLGQAMVDQANRL